MKISLSKFLLSASALSILSSVFFVQSAYTAELVRQEFQGTFSLTDDTFFFGNPLPPSSQYSGFIAYEEDGTIGDYQLDVSDLSLSLNLESDQESIDSFLSIGGIDFELEQPSRWELSVDLGIGGDAPKYLLERNDSEITFTGFIGLLGSYEYSDPMAAITQPGTSVPEPGTILGLAVIGTMGMLLSGRIERSRQ